RFFPIDQSSLQLAHNPLIRRKNFFAPGLPWRSFPKSCLVQNDFANLLGCHQDCFRNASSSNSSKSSLAIAHGRQITASLTNTGLAEPKHFVNGCGSPYPVRCGHTPEVCLKKPRQVLFELIGGVRGLCDALKVLG